MCNLCSAYRTGEKVGMGTHKRTTISATVVSGYKAVYSQEVSNTGKNGRSGR